MLKDREKTILKRIFLIVLFYLAVEHFSAVKNIVFATYKVISPLIYGIVIAFVVDLLVVRLEKHMTKGIFVNKKIRRTISMIVSFLILTGLITIVCFSVIPGIADSVRQIAEKAPYAMDSTLLFLEKHFGISSDMIANIRQQNIKLDQDFVGSLLGLMENRSVMNAIKASGNMVGSIVSVFAKFFIGLFFSCYILARKEEINAYLHSMIKTYLPEKIARRTEYFCKIVYDTYSNFISGQCVDAIILGCMVAIAMGIMRLPYPILVGVIVSVTALIPVVGALFGGTIGVVLLVMDSPIKALTFLIVFLILQQIDNRLIYPHVVGNAIGIPSILIFSAIVIGGSFGGVIGMFLGIPFTAVLYTLLDADMKKRKEEK